MNELLIINKETRTITAKDLYNFLGLNKSNYSKWTKANIENNPFATANVDYTPFVLQDECGGQATTDYKLTIDFAKKICMTSKSDKGEQARNYFIEVEKQYQAITEVVEIPSIVAEYLAMSEEDRAIGFFTKSKEIKLLLETNSQNVEEIAQLLITNEQMQPAVDFYNTVANSDKWLSMQEVALLVAHKDLGQNKLFNFLVRQNILIDSYKAYSAFVKAGYFKAIEMPYEYIKDGIKKSGINTKLVVSQRGVKYIIKLLKADGFKLKSAA